MKRSRRISALLVGLVATSLGAGLLQLPAIAAESVPSSAAGSPAPETDKSSVPSADREKVLGKGWQNSGDLAWTTTSDAQGFHILTANENAGYAWKTVASLAEPGLDADAWIGNACVTGSGRRAVVVYAPRTFTNKPQLMARGAFTAVVELDTGKVTKLDLRASLSYYNPGCGTGESAVFTQSGGDDKSGTRLVSVDAVTAKLATPVEVTGQVTSGVPVDGAVVAANGAQIVKIDAQGRSRTLARTASVPYRLSPDADGGITFLDQQPRKSAADRGTTQVRRVAGGKTSTLGEGPLTHTGLVRAGGDVYITGDAKAAKSLPARVKSLPGSPKDALVSTGGKAVVQRTEWADVKDSTLQPESALDARPVKIELSVLDTKKKVGFTADPLAVIPDSWKQGRDPAPAAGRKTAKGADPAAPSGAKSTAEATASAAAAAAASSPTEIVESDRTCSVPRNDPRNQAMQPKPRQVEWAADQAVTGFLNTHIERPANWKNLGMPAYMPQSLFLNPPLEGGGRVPAQVLLGITTQESNMWQAARSTVPGVTGNPLIGNYYGIDYYDGTDANDWDVNFAEADCGYGITQVTDHMRMAGREDGHGGAAWPYQTQRAVALDYTANISAGLQILIEKWNETYNAGMKLNNANPAKLENWYFALWAYNSGFHPQGAAGEPWGLGWFNNPANPEWDAARPPFLENWNGDEDASAAARPQLWPYPEKVLGFAAHPPSFLESPGKMVPAFIASYWNGTAAPVDAPGSAKYNRAHVKPPENLFCTAANSCNPAKIGDTATNDTTTSGPCGRADFKCWWSGPATWKEDCSASCGFEFIRFNSTYPEEADGTPYAPNCSTSGLPSNALIIDDVPDGTPSVRPNCGRPWTNQGSFGMTFSKSSGESVYPSKVDLHQLGAGFGGHFYFGHTRASDVKGERLKITGTWTLNKSLNQWARVMVHIPDHGAHTRQARYQVYTGSGASFRAVPQRIRSNKWVSIGVFQFNGVPQIKLDSIAQDGTGDEDIAWDAVAVQPLAAKPEHMIVAMGDSYSSGEGASVTGGGDYYPETDYGGDQGSARNACHRSKNAWIRQAGAPYDSGIGRTFGTRADAWGDSGSIDLQFIACSGARTHQILSGNGEGPTNAWGKKGGSSYGELPQLDKGYLDSNTTLVTLSIGGNDAGYSDVIKKCMLLTFPTSNCFDDPLDGESEAMRTSVPKTLATKVRPSIVTTLKEIALRAPNAKIVLMGYPMLFSNGVNCAGAPFVNSAEYADFGTVTNTMATEMGNAAADARAAGVRVVFADPRIAFNGKGICGTPETIHGIVNDKTPSDKPGDPVSAQGFHPKTTGAAIYAGVLNDALKP